MRIADEVVILEPNGWNPILKLIEKFSEYHRQHDEKSFSPLRIASWVRAVGGSVDYVKFVGLVPFFCPNWLARVLKATEPVIERLPVLRRYLCGVCVMRVARGRRCSRL